jgi:GGDEF domain-containing protein
MFMLELRNSLLLLLTYVIGFLGITQIQFLEQQYIDFDPIFFYMFAFAAAFGILIPGRYRPSIYIILTSWAVVYALIWLLYWRTYTDPLTSFVLVLQLILVELTAGLSHFVGLHLDEVDNLLGQLSSTVYPNRMMELDQAWERINTEMTRSRRFSRPLSVLMVEMKNVQNRVPVSKIDHLQRDLLVQFAVSKTGQIISNLARQTDLIVHESNGRFLIVCPETDLAASTILAERVRTAVEEQIDNNVVWGAAAFPDESYSFDELLEKAKHRLGYMDGTSVASEVESGVETGSKK